MILFEISSAGQESLPVFARSYDEAAGIYVSHRIMDRVAELTSFEVKKRNPAWPGLDVQLLAEALSRQVVGVGRFDVTDGWIILSSDQAREAAA